MKPWIGREGCIWIVLFSGVVPASAQAPPRVSLKVMRVNGDSIAPTTSLFARPGDQLDAEIVIEDWGPSLPEGIRLYQALVLGQSGAVSGSNGTVLPLGWKAEVDPKRCDNSNECREEEVCRERLCVRPDHNPDVGSFLDVHRTDFIHVNTTGFADTNNTKLTITYFSISIKSEGTIDVGQPAYGGTLRLVVSPFACGRFVFQLACRDTILGGPDNQSVPLELDPLVIDVGECPLLPLSSTPSGCLIDPAVPHPQGDESTPLGWDGLDILFDQPPTEITTESFQVELFPPDKVVAPGISGVTPVGDRSVRVALDSIIPLEHWTCVRHLDSDRLLCLGFLPPDHDQDRMSTPEDIVSLVAQLEELNDPVPIDLRCDLDRNQRCTALDVLTGVDLLNGVGFESWQGGSIDATCPSRESFPIPADRGACCDTRTGSCASDVPFADCSDPREIWSIDTPCCSVACDPPLGACCNLLQGFCQENIPRVNCLGDQYVWSEGGECSLAFCPLRGACCNQQTVTCRDFVDDEDCLGADEFWVGGARCNEILCVPR